MNIFLKLIETHASISQLVARALEVIDNELQLQANYVHSSVAVESSTFWLSSRNFFGGGSKICCYANVSIVFRQDFTGQKSLRGTAFGGGALLLQKKACFVGESASQVDKPSDLLE